MTRRAIAIIVLLILVSGLSSAWAFVVTDPATTARNAVIAVLKSRVLEKTLRGRGKRGEVIWYRGITNQEGKTVQEGELVTLVECRPLVRPGATADEADAVVKPIPAVNGSRD